MLNAKRLFFSMLLVITGLSGNSAGKAQNLTCYSLASLNGSYAVVGNYGANVAIALGVREFDGNGNFTAAFRVNEPMAGSNTGARQIVTGTQKGTYTVNCDGTGVITRLLTLADGTTATGMDDFLITSSKLQAGQLIATAVSDAQRTPSAIVPGGIFLNRTYSLRPDVQCYTPASIQGSYAVIADYGANVATSLGVRTLDGNGNMTATFIVNEPTAGSTTGERTIVTGKQKGTYAVNCDGTGTVTRLLTLANGTMVSQVDDFLITGAVVQNGQPIATSLADAVRVPSAIVPGGIFITRTHNLRPSPRTLAIAAPKNVTVTARAIQLDGSSSTSADGSPLTFEWTIPQGSPSAAILGASTATPTVQFTESHAQYSFQLTVTDSTGNSSSDLVTVNFEGN